jgi:putative FmdB family regulatory protein
MPTYSFDCDKHGVFDLTLPLRKWAEKKKCPKCGKQSLQVLLPSVGRGVFQEPIVVHVDSTGRVRFPGRRDAKLKKGYERRELKSIREVERFERQMNIKFKAEAEQHNENEDRIYQEAVNKNRRELRSAMEHMSPAGLAFAKFAINQNNMRKRKSSEVGFHVRILHYDSANEPWVDKDTGWKRKYV